MSLANLQKELECPVCFEQFEVERIVMCTKGHSVCSDCVKDLRNGRCPFCREGFGGARNYALDAVIRKLNEMERNGNTEQPQPPLPTQMAPKINQSAFVASKEDEFTCRMVGCTTRLPIKSLINHVRDRHFNYLDDIIKVLSYKPWVIKRRIVFAPTVNQCAFTIIDGKELFALIYQPDPELDGGKRAAFCWVQAACSYRDAKAYSYSIRLISQTTQQCAAEYYDYMHGECSDADEICDEMTCLFVMLPKYEEVVTLDVEIYETLPGPLGPRRDVTDIFEQRYE